MATMIADTPSVLWAEMTAGELNQCATAGAIVLLPVASTEQHGPHLATSVDTLLCGEVCRRVAVKLRGRLPVVVAPTVWMGLAEHHVALGGTFTLSLATWHALLADLCRSIRRAGFSKTLIVNGHGGNVAALQALTTDLTVETGLAIATMGYWAPPETVEAFAAILERGRSVQHACEAETSMMMATAPGLVRSERLGEAHGTEHVGLPGSLPAMSRWRSFKEITPSGVMGDARLASAAKGEAMFEAAAEAIAARLARGEPWA